MRIELPSGTTAELATPSPTPSSSSSLPSLGVALCPDVMGLRPLFDDLCARLAAEHGWAVCAVEPFPGREELALEDRLEAPLHDGLLDDLLAAAATTGAERTAVLGFCMGGLVAFLAAGLGRFDRAASFYGMIRPPEQWSGLGQPLEALAEAEASETIAITAGQDRWAPDGDVADLRALDRVEVVVYSDADHGFVHDPSRPTHRPDDAADAWRRVTAFLTAD